MKNIKDFKQIAQKQSCFKNDRKLKGKKIRDDL